MKSYMIPRKAYIIPRTSFVGPRAASLAPLARPSGGAASGGRSPEPPHGPAIAAPPQGPRSPEPTEVCW